MLSKRSEVLRNAAFVSGGLTIISGGLDLAGKNPLKNLGAPKVDLMDALETTSVDGVDISVTTLMNED